MRKHRKKAIENFIELLLEANNEIQKSLKAGNLLQAMELLGQCQEGAVKTGTLIEESEGADVITIHMLEEYCEDLYRFYGEMRQDQVQNINKSLKGFRKQLIRIQNSIKHDIRETTEAVFLPYKASMWDSLESVWQAAEADENCDAYVIPIPYYDRNPDRSFQEMHYEGNLFPDYVPITHYVEYNLKERRPDRIYIHNPYDGQNLVTSVHPDFYSKNLKQFTEQLIYIPYFVLGEVDPDNKEAVEGIKHFCTVPGVFNADKVIVQSEAMRQVYIKVLTEETVKSRGHGNEKEIRRYWENKIDGSGSPKFNKILNTKKETLKIPEEWKRIIEKSDGTWKTVILYNTAVAGLLQNNEKALQKIEDVLKIFYEYRSEVALLWRPHPLLESTLSSMRPQLLEEYKKIRDSYIRGDWGIYDDTADLDRAIVLSDAYYGDGSSLVELCRKMEKPIMIQNVEVCSQCETACKEAEV
ncbi:MAG: hypothetical protein HFE76_08045 [Firmicutes bacterium]|nr:hypothetical protein [Bacillota bacterium]